MTAPRPRSRRRVLVVDDDELIRQVVGTILDLEDFEVETAEGGQEALAIIADRVPDAIVLDVMMPGMSGLEVCRAIKDDERTAAVPVVLLTARDQPEDRVTGEQAGCDGYLAKPFSPLELIDLIDQLVGGA